MRVSKAFPEKIVFLFAYNFIEHMTEMMWEKILFSRLRYPGYAEGQNERGSITASGSSGWSRQAGGRRVIRVDV